MPRPRPFDGKSTRKLQVKDLPPAPARDAEGHLLHAGDHVTFDVRDHDVRSGQVVAADHAWVKIDGSLYRALLVRGDDGKSYTFSAEHTHLAKRSRERSRAKERR